jgi:YesN/AraC family two-component response regulator
LELFHAQPDKFDLVITDMTMPQMPGTSLIKEMLMVRPDLPIILCTGFSERYL